ncbi:hypothetical protein NFI96_001056 [Prochilodus magdalenae]|nr:hypothetical protein NFI96_001056 [Prochilodus magdalenae]
MNRARSGPAGTRDPCSTFDVKQQIRLVSHSEEQLRPGAPHVGLTTRPPRAFAAVLLLSVHKLSDQASGGQARTPVVEDARGGGRPNWCAYVVTKTVSCVVEDGVETYVKPEYQPCSWGVQCARVVITTVNQGTYQKGAAP